MILFKSIKWKNFLSTGNVFTEVKLNDTSNTLIVGENGAGKSTILDALTFALFGKAFRKINKPLLINSVNAKDCVVELEFDVNGKKYKVVRGIKPNIFEIYCNDVLLNQDSASKDYQEHLEKFILKMNYKSFTQIVILGSASFTPFMQLSAADRRAVIEDLLDIQIFSVMNIIAKQKLQVNKELFEKNRISLIGKEEKRLYVEKTIASLKQNNEEKKSNRLAQLLDLDKAVTDLQSIIDEKEAERDSLLEKAVGVDSFKSRHTKLIKLHSQIDTNLKRTKKELSFYCDNDDCPTCRQPIAAEFKATEIAANEKKIDEYQDGLSALNDQIEKTIKSISEIEQLISKANSLREEISSNKSRVSSLRLQLEEVRKELEQLNDTDSILASSITELALVNSDIDVLTQEKKDLLSERQYIDTAINLLKDGGIKTKIIRQYLPVINKLINKYLAKMGFFVNFNINEQFEETIKSRYRDEFSYQNFSEGEKTRIDLALLFTWRAIAKMRNSVNTNLLILDEVLDGSLDNNGTDEFLKIMWDLLQDTNTFVISHKTDTMVDRFQKVLRFQKQKNFSRLV